MLPNELPNENEPPQDPSASLDPAAPTIPQPQPNYATRDDLMGVMESVKSIAAAIQQGVVTRSVTPELPTPEVSDTEFMDAINSGTPTVALKKLTENIKQSLLREHILPLKEQGLQSISTLVKDAAASHPDMPYFKKFEKQIMELVAAVPINQRADVNTYKTAYAIVAGQNISAIVKEEMEKQLRAKDAGDSGQLPNGTSKPSNSGGIPTVAELCGADAAAALDANGWTPDIYAQKILHAKTWAEAAVNIQKFNLEHPTNA